MSNQETSFHPYLRNGWVSKTVALNITVPPSLPDVNPADSVVARMRAKRYGSPQGNVLNGLLGTSDAGSGGSGGPGDGGGNSGGNPSNNGGGGGGGGVSDAWIREKLGELQIRVCGILTALNGASIAASCNGDGTITVTLTMPGLPANC